MSEAQAIKQFTSRYMERSNVAASVSFFGTMAAYLATLWLALEAAWAWPVLLPLLVVNSFAAVRLYVIQHDLGHWSHFRTRRQNDLAGYLASTFTLTPYKAMQYNHNRHHAHIGNLDERDSTEIHTMTLREWERASPLQRLAYRLYRNPFLMIPFGGFWTFAIRYRWPKNARRVGVPGIVAHDLAVLGWLALIFAGYGWSGLGVYGLTVLISGSIGVFLVYLQHNFEDTYWDRKPDLDYARATLQGSSALDLGWWWDLGTGNIAYHDIHHFNPRIPLYNLRRCHRALREEMDIRTIGWSEALRSFRLKLWDEEQGRLIPFPNRVRAPRAPVPAE
ncbi:fatty acid desaturase [Rhodovulum sp. 12E13]|uniref:fatty acid desaturase n=1 Tax=Rhodovulum sp. 12E13 TaxID=2203891 RepID=UPI000E179113|nr:fatty acid desaturase [Rhodovulum sp. 12E13]RDC72804.1 fatty acid desaturase [Rhodovulum sp. 12E13]